MAKAVAERREPALLLSIDDVADLIGVGTRTLWRWCSCGQFPLPDLSMGAKVRRWKRETVTKWIESRAAAEVARDR